MHVLENGRIPYSKSEGVWLIHFAKYRIENSQGTTFNLPDEVYRVSTVFESWNNHLQRIYNYMFYQCNFSRYVLHVDTPLRPHSDELAP